MDAMNLDENTWDESMFDDVLGENPDFINLLVFLIDSSGSMEGTVMGSVNSVMEELFSELEKDSYDTRIAVLAFGEEGAWAADLPKSVSEFGAWHRIRGGALSNMGTAFRMLAGQLMNPSWCPAGRKGTRGKFILFSDGMTTDRYEEGLAVLRRVPLFQQGEKLAVNFSDISAPEVLSDFTEKEENVILCKSSEILTAEKKILAFIKGQGTGE